jgi:uncharacterized iron-regulated membrane protein
MNSRTLVLAAVLVIVAIAGYFYLLSPEAQLTASQPTTVQSPAPAAPPAASPPTAPAEQPAASDSTITSEPPATGQPSGGTQ